MKDESNKSYLIGMIENFGLVYENREKDPAVISEINADIKRLYGYQPTLHYIASEVLNGMGEGVTCIASSGYGGAPLSSYILSLNKKLKQSFVRDRPKQKNAGGWFDGHIPTEVDSVWIVEDVFSRGRSLAHVADVLKEAEAEIAGYTAVLKRKIGAVEMGFPSYFLIDAEADLKHLL